MSNSGEIFSIEESVERAQQGDRSALEAILKQLKKNIHTLSLKFLWHPQDAEDATQEILIKVASHIGSYRAQGTFHSWVYRIACNKLLSLRKKRAELNAMSWEEFAHDLTINPDNEGGLIPDLDEVQRRLLVEEVRVACTQAMLLCMDRKHRVAYILGEILELDHNQASQVLAISPATFRKRLSRARTDITSLMMSRCGVVNELNPCRCSKRIPRALACGRLKQDQMMFAPDAKELVSSDVLIQVRQLDEDRRAWAMFQSHPAPRDSADFTLWLHELRELLDKHGDLTRAEPE